MESRGEEGSRWGENRVGRHKLGPRVAAGGALAGQRSITGLILPTDYLMNGHSREQAEVEAVSHLLLADGLFDVEGGDSHSREPLLEERHVSSHSEHRVDRAVKYAFHTQRVHGPTGRVLADQDAMHVALLYHLQGGRDNGR